MKISILFIVMSFLVFGSCARHQERRIAESSATATVGAMGEVRRVSSDGEVVYVQKQMSGELRKFWEEQRARSILKAERWSEKSGFQLYRLDSGGVPSELALALPLKLDWDAQSPGARVFQPDGSLLIRFRLRMDSMEIPQAVREEVFRRYSPHPKLVRLFGCPEIALLESGNRNYLLKPEGDTAGSCRNGNQEYPFSLRIEVGEIREFMAEQAKEGSDRLKVSVQLMGLTDGDSFELRFNQETVFRALEKSARGQEMLCEGEVNDILRAIVNQQVAKVGAEQDAAPHTEKLIWLFRGTFLQKEKTRTCLSGESSYQVNFDYPRGEPELSYLWRKDLAYSFPHSRVNILELKRSPKVSAVDQGKSEGLSNQAGSNVMIPDLRVWRGDWMRISDPALYAEERKIIEGKGREEHHRVCVQMVPNIERRCQSECKEVGRAGDTREQCRDICRDVQNGEKCGKDEDWWIKTVSFGLEAFGSFARQDPLEQGKRELLHKGIHMGFFKEPPGESITCPLSAFEMINEEHAVLLRIDQSDLCPIFQEDGVQSLGLSLMNKIEEPIPYLEGQVVSDWEGRVSKQVQSRLYSPYRGLIGNLGLYPGGFKTGSSVWESPEE